MVSFDNVLVIAKKTIKAWEEYPSVKEVTLIRDVFGYIAVLLSGAGLDSISRDKLCADLKAALGYYFSGRMYLTEKPNNDLERRIIKEIEQLRHQTDRDKNCIWYELERTIAKKAWLDQAGKRKPVWTYEEACAGTKPKVISFYSFKGGMGRTTALAATALILAQKGCNVLAIDTDIEAPGLSSFFFDDSRIKRGTVDFFVEYQADESYAPDIRDYLIEVDDASLKEEVSGKIFVLPAGQTNEGYLSKLARIDYQDVKMDGMRKTMVRLIKLSVDFLQQKEKKVDYILLDSRAGFHDMGGVVTFQIPHVIVLVGRDNRQSWRGIKEAILLAGTTQEERIPFVLIDSMCEVIPGIAKQQREAFKKQAYTLCCDFYYLVSEMLPGLEAVDAPHAPVYIPYNPILNEEICLYSDGSREASERVFDVKNAMYADAYQELVRRICNWFGSLPVESEGSNNVG